MNGITGSQSKVTPPSRMSARIRTCSTAARNFSRPLKIPLLLGRDFNQRDIAGAPKVAIVNQKFVQRYFGEANPLGRHIGMGIDPGTKTDIQIVGVAGDTKYESMRDEVPYELYIPGEQKSFATGGTVYVD